MFRKILLYGLPVYLYGLELLLRTLANVKADSVAGPTLAGAGIGFLLPLTQLKQVAVADQKLQATLAKMHAKVHSSRDQQFTEFVWFMFFVSLGSWMYSLYLTLKPTQAQTVAIAVPLNWPLSIGCAIFFVSIILAEIKERV